MTGKLSVEQVRRVEEIESYLKVVAHVKHLVAELESNRAAQARVLQGICESIARDLSQLRQRALTSNVGTIADVAGAMSVMAARSGGINLKIRGLKEGVTSLDMQLEHALKVAMTPEPTKGPTPRT